MDTFTATVQAYKNGYKDAAKQVLKEFAVLLEQGYYSPELIIHILAEKYEVEVEL